MYKFVKKTALLLPLVLNTQLSSASNSLYNVLDTVESRVNVLNEFAKILINNEPQKALDHTRDLTKLGYKSGVASCYNNLGVPYKNRDIFDKALGYYIKSFEVNEFIENTNSRTLTKMNIGNIYSLKKDYNKNIGYFMDSYSPSLLIEQEKNNKLGQISISRPRMLVENQPLFKSFTFENVVPFQKERLLETTYQHRYHRLQGFPIPIANREGLLISFGVGFASDQYDNQHPQSIEENNDVLWFQFFNTGSIGSDYFWRSLSAWGSYATSIDFKNTNTHKFSQFLQFGRKWKPNLSTSLGVLYLTNFGDQQIVPLAHVIYSKKSWVFDMLLPIDVSVRYLYSDNLQFTVRNKLQSRSYWYNSEALKLNTNELSINAEIRLTGVLWSELGLGQPYSSKLSWQIEDMVTEIGDTSNPLLVKLGLFIRFPDKDIL